jgi:hypothetical protein
LYHELYQILISIHIATLHSGINGHLHAPA